MQDEERRRIARELHDSTAQSLIALAMNLASVNGSVVALDPKARQALSDSLSLAEQCSQEIRTLSYLLHPPMLDEVGLTCALRWYATGFTQRSGIRVDLDIPSRLGRLPREVEMALFRIVQESFTNIHRHSGSPTVRIRIVLHPSEITLEVADQGRGIPPPGPEKSSGNVSGLGVGINGMRERLKQLQGRLEISSGSHGTVVKAVLPL